MIVKIIKAFLCIQNCRVTLKDVFIMIYQFVGSCVFGWFLVKMFLP